MILLFLQKIFAERAWNTRFSDRSTGKFYIVELNVSKVDHKKKCQQGFRAAKRTQ
jgi:hypothetical protein